MAVDGRRITYPSRGVDRPAYLARPSGGERRPAVLVIHEIFGVTPHIEDVARRFAGEGYVALAPDLFALGGRPVSDEAMEDAMALVRTLPPEARRDAAAVEAKLATLPDERRGPARKALEWLQRRDLDAHTPDMVAALDWLAAQPYVRADRIGVVGFCMGGALAFRLAAEGAPLAACIVFYGQHPPVERLSRIRCPVLGLYGSEDRPITDAVPALAGAMRSAGKSFESHAYPDAAHAFFNDTRPDVYRKEASEDAWRRVLAFYRQHLG